MASITARHVTIAGAGTADSLDSSTSPGLLPAQGNIAMTANDAIVLGATPQVHRRPPGPVPPNTAS